jgi:hypothetical protein
VDHRVSPVTTIVGRVGLFSWQRSVEPGHDDLSDVYVRPPIRLAGGPDLLQQLFQLFGEMRIGISAGTSGIVTGCVVADR